MKAQELTSAKISRPGVPGDVLVRERLFGILDEVRNRAVIWVSGFAGSGKTTLVSSFVNERDLASSWYTIDGSDEDPASFFYYLGLLGRKAAPRRKKNLPLFTPEYAMGLDRFTHRFFEDLYSRLHVPGLLVFDNVQEISDESLFHKVILEGTSRMPKGLNIVLISRDDPPPEYSRLLVNRDMGMIGGDRIRLELDEFKAILRDHGYGDLEDHEVEELHRRLDGWAAGVMLMINAGSLRDFYARFGHKEGPGELFDYFARTVWEDLDEDLKDFLMETSHLPSMTAHMANDLTGNPGAARILSELCRKNLFTVKFQQSPVQYQYHPLFSDYLKTNAQESFSAKERLNLHLKAAETLTASGQIEGAVGLLLDAQAWEKTTGLILTEARDLVTAGRVQTLLNWLEALPEEVTEKSPWLAYWAGVCRSQLGIPDGKEWLIKAYSGFGENNDKIGMLLSLTGICEALFFLFEHEGIEHWVGEIFKQVNEKVEFPSREIEGLVLASILMHLIFNRPYPEEVGPWEERALKLASQAPHEGYCVRTLTLLCQYYSWTGDFGKFSQVLNLLKTNKDEKEIRPVLQLNSLLYESVYSWLRGDIEECRDNVSRGLALANETGIHFLSPWFFSQMIYSSLSVENVEEGEQYLTRYRECIDFRNKVHAAHYHFLNGWIFLARRDILKSFSEIKLSDRLATESNSPFPMAIGKIGLANTLIETGDYNQAHRELKNADLIARKMNSHLLKFQCQAGWALIALEKGDEKVLFKHLRLMTSIGKNHDLVNTPFWRPSVMSRLFAKALEYGIEVDYSRAIIRKRNLLPPEGHKQNLNNWPWPLQVSTLGTFKLVRNGKAVRFSGKSQKKPMELLKALIAFGGKEVSVPKLLDFLWPDSDGDMAQNSFNAALHRLRNLVGIREAIALQDGMLSLDPRYCWVDLWAFEGACEAADQAFGDDQSGGDFLDAAQRAIDLFTGHFLPDDLTDWAVFPRERIRNRYWKVASRLGRYLEKKDENEKAIEYYLKALDIDDLSEEAYIKLMNCYERVGRKADALILYERCKKTLDEVLGVEPSPEMEIIYRRIRS